MANTMMGGSVTPKEQEEWDEIRLKKNKRARLGASSAPTRVKPLVSGAGVRKEGRQVKEIQGRKERGKIESAHSGGE